MIFEVLDVGHGSCVILEDHRAPRNLMLFDCGHKTDPLIRPSAILAGRGHTSVEQLFILNYDEDHISDLANLASSLNIRMLTRNPSISSAELRRLKLQQSGEISPSMQVLLEMMSAYVHGVDDGDGFDIPGTSYELFWNNHPIGVDDTNNISLVVVLDIQGCTFLLPGDIERTGWQQLLIDNHRLRDWLPRIDYFIASHHGREGGYYDPMFTEFGCRPKAFIFSDSTIQHRTQERMSQLYGQWARGCQFNGQTRYVLTTRQDRSIQWAFD